MTSLEQELADKIGKYAEAHSELASARWYSYLERFSDAVEYLFIDSYPSETADEQSLAFELCRQRGPIGDQHDRQKRIEKFMGHKEFAAAYFFFWSARNTHQFKKRFGTSAIASPHLEFCRDVNARILNSYNPKAVVCNGVSSSSKRLCRLYSLQLVEEQLDKSRNVLVKHFSDGNRPWLFIKHLSGSFGYTKDQRQLVQDYVRRHLD